MFPLFDVASLAALSETVRILLKHNEELYPEDYRGQLLGVEMKVKHD